MAIKPQIQNILFLDIETVPGVQNFTELNDEWQALFESKVKYQIKEGETVEEKYQERAGILSEFNKVVCVSTGFCFEHDGKTSFRSKSFYGDDEKELLLDLANLLRNHYSQQDKFLCAHNGKEFDFPVLARRMLINGIELPPCLDIAGLKPWEVKHLDTMELWKFGDWKHYTSLKLLAALFGIPSPKDDIDGSQVASVYYEEKNLERIKVYCEKDTFTLAQVYRAMNRMPLMDLASVAG